MALQRQKRMWLSVNLKQTELTKMGKKQSSSLIFSEIVEGKLLCKVNFSLARHISLTVKIQQAHSLGEFL